VITLHERKLSTAGLFGISKVSLPCDLIIFVLLIKDVSRVHVVLNNDFSTAVLQEFFPSCSDLVRLFRNFKWGRRHEERWTHIYVVKRQKGKEAKDSHCITTRDHNVAFAQSELPNLYIIYFQNMRLLHLRNW